MLHADETPQSQPPVKDGVGKGDWLALGTLIVLGGLLLAAFTDKEDWRSLRDDLLPEKKKKRRK